MTSRKCGKFILTCVVLLGWLGMLRGILARKYEAANISRGNVYCIYVTVTAFVSAPHPPVTIKLNLPPTFQTVSNDEGLCSFFPLKRTKETDQVEN